METTIQFLITKHYAGQSFDVNKIFDKYEEAEKYIKESLPAGNYSIQKIFVKA